MVKVGGSRSGGCGFEPWMDVSDASYYIKTHKNNENKGSQMGHTKKYLKKWSV